MTAGPLSKAISVSGRGMFLVWANKEIENPARTIRLKKRHM